MAVATTAMPGTTIQVKHVPATKEPTDNEETIKNIDSFWMSSARIGAKAAEAGEDEEENWETGEDEQDTCSSI